MSLQNTITPAILHTVIGHLSGHFLNGANGDLATARHAAARMLACYKVETEEELHLASDIVSFGFHALKALSESAEPELSLNNKLRLRSGAVSLSREGHKARRKLEQLRRTRAAASVQPEENVAIPHKAAPDKPAVETVARETAATGQARDLIEFAREAIQASGKKGGIQGFSFNHQQRRAAEKIAKNLQRNRDESMRREAAKAAATGQQVAL
jgi:hypothetical protein